MRGFNLDASRMSTQKPRVTILAAIVSQAKNGENGAFQEVLPVRRSHIRTVTLRAGACSPHKTTSILSCAEREKSASKNGQLLGYPTRQDGSPSTAQGNCTLLRTSLTRQPAAYQSTP